MTDLTTADQLHPAYGFGKPNESVQIADDEAEILDSAGNTLLSGTARIVLDLLPRPKINVHIESAADWPPPLSGDHLAVRLKRHSLEIEGFATQMTVESSVGTSMIWTPRSEPIVGVGDNGTELCKVIFHLLNFNDFVGSERTVEQDNTGHHVIEHLRLQAGAWTVNIRSLVDTRTQVRQLRGQGGCGLTHIGCLRRPDGSCFSGQDAHEGLGALRYFLSFAKGAWCEPVCAVGFDALGNRVWESWSSPRESWASPRSWFDTFHPEQLTELFPGFLHRWSTPDWCSAFREVLYWYLSANRTRPDVGTILTQTGLERVSFEYAVKDRCLIETGGFKKLRASDKLRLLLSSLDIPIAIAQCPPNLRKVAGRNKWADLPHAMTEVRNAIVHPDHRLRRQEDLALRDTCSVGLWYLELAVLRLCNYSGTYQNRLAATHEGQVEPVPWSS